jgi:hypothetical protein
VKLLLDLTIDSDLDGTSPGKHISERRISMAESEWAKRMAQGFKAGKTRKAQEDGMGSSWKGRGLGRNLLLNCGQMSERPSSTRPNV